VKVERIEELLRAGPPGDPVFLPVTFVPESPGTARGPGTEPDGPRLERVRSVRRAGLLPARGRERLALLAATVGAAMLLVVAVAVLLGSGERRPVVVVASPSPTGSVVPSTAASPSLRASPSAAPSPEVTPGSTPTPALPGATPIAWTDATPTPAPSTTPLPVPPGTAPCVAENLAATIGFSGAGGAVFGNVSVTNRGRAACSLDGAPQAILIRPASGEIADVRYRSDSRSWPGDRIGTVAPPVLLRIADAAHAEFIWSNWCGARFSSSSVVVTLPGLGGTVSLDGPGRFSSARCDSPSGSSDLVGFAFAPEAPKQPEPPPPVELTVALDLPASAAPGETLHYRVELANHGINSAALTPCPVYTESLYGSKEESSYLLNCAGSGPSIEPGATLVFDVEFLVPVDAAPGVAELFWQVDMRWDARISGTARAPFTVTTP
jgi:hypothetical protein